MGSFTDQLPLEPEFVGEGRHQLVEGLLKVHDLVTSNQRPRWVALEGPSGSGKTRVVREFYAALAERQPQPAYWPPTIVGSQGDASIDDVSTRRKRVYPVVRHAPGSRPSFFWWGIAASLRNGTAVDALAVDLHQLEAHQLHLDDAWRQLRSFTQRNPQWWKRPGEALLAEGMETAATSALESIVNASLPGIGLVVPALARIKEAAAERRDRRDRLASTAEVSRSTLDALDQTVALLTRLATPGLPVIIFVEDFHKADEALVELVARCATSEAPILLITTSTDALEAKSTSSPSLSSAAASCLRISPGMGRLPEPFPPAASMDPLEDAALASIVEFYYPRAEAATVRLLVDRYRNPLALELFCCIERYRRKFPDGQLTLTADQVARLPNDIKDLYRELWRELPDRVREALAIASLAVPGAHAPAAGGADLSWHLPFLKEALSSLDRSDAEEIIGALETDPAAVAWARWLSPSMQAFREPAQRETAHEDDNYLDPEDRAEILSALGEVVRRRLADIAVGDQTVGSTAESLHLAGVALMLHQTGNVRVQDVAEAVGGAGEALSDQPREATTVLELTGRALAQIGRNDPESWLRIARPRADALFETGQLGAASALYSEIASVSASTVGEHELATLRARFHDAFGRVAVGDHETALGILETLVPDASRSLGEQHGLTLAAQGMLARAYKDAGRLEEALTRAEAAVEGYRATVGQRHPDARIAVATLARIYGAMGRKDMELDLLRHVLVLHDGDEADEKSRLIETINLAATLANTGQLQEATELLEQVAEQSDRLNGAEHPATRHARVLLAEICYATGRRDDALELLLQVWADSSHLAMTHEESLASRSALVEIPMGFEDWEAVIDMSTKALDTDAVTLASNHFRSARAMGLYHLSRFDEASMEYAEALKIAQRDGVDTDTIRESLMQSLAQAGRHDEVVALAEETLRMRRSDSSPVGRIDEVCTRFLAFYGDEAHASDETEPRHDSSS